MKNMRVLLWAHLPYPSLSSTICYLLTRLKSPLFYLIKSKSYDQDERCLIYDNFSHFITYVVDFFIQGQISYLMNARPRASTVLKMSSAFSLSLISGGSSKTTVLKRWFLCSWVVTLRRNGRQEARCSLIRWLSITLRVYVSWRRLL